jgi:hypothetical protein
MSLSTINETPNQALERPAARCAFTFKMAKTVSVQVTLATARRPALSP